MVPTHKNYYPFPPARHFPTIHPRTIHPLREPHPSLLLYPPLLPPEAHQRVLNGNGNAGIGEILPGFTLSTHIFPASYPRVTPRISLSPSAASDLASLHPLSPSPSITQLSKEERKKKVKKVTDELVELKRRHIKGEFPPDDGESRVLWSVVNRYYRRSSSVRGHNRKSITLVLFHANGLHKETWEPFLRHLIPSLESESSRNGSEAVSVSIDEIWTLDETAHGDAALVNQGKLSALYDWTDHTRDILNFLTRFLPTSPSQNSDLPVHLPRVSEAVEKQRLLRGFVDSEGDGERTVVAIGHSLGGATVTLAACTIPSLFHTLILVDPTIAPTHINRSSEINSLCLGAIQRRHVWPNREEAKRLFEASPFFAAWDPDVRESYVQLALTPAPGGGEDGLGEGKKESEGVVTLKMPGLQEAAIFAESRVSHEVFERLASLDPRVKLHWVMAGRGSWITGSEEATRDVVWRRRANATNTQLDSEHLIVQQAPKELATEVHAVLQNLFSTKDKSAGEDKGWGEKARL